MAVMVSALTMGEVLIAYGLPLIGIFVHMALLLALLIYAGTLWHAPQHQLFVSLIMAPLVRIVSLAFPLGNFPLRYWFLITGIPLIAAATAAIRHLGYSREQVGLTLKSMPLQLAIGLTGLGLGAIEYLILRPAPLVEHFRWSEIWLPALILLVATGFLEELIFRGLMQRAASETLGRWGIPVIALIFAVLHLGYRSVADFVFVLVVALLFGLMVRRTGSIIGVTLSHGLTNIMLFLVMPFLAGGS
jgi:hypothetical protein